jgi:hypothetical protein
MSRWIIVALMSISLTTVLGGWGVAPAAAADIRKIESVYATHFEDFYEPRFCGRNIARLIQAAQDQKISLKGAYVLKIEGAGFFETSGFYTRTAPNEREMLGYFHVILVAGDRVMDFDLHEPLVLDIQEYIRLQFTPPEEKPMVIFGVPYRAREELKWWTVTRFEIDDFLRESKRATWKKKLGEYVNLNAVFALDRSAILAR